MVQEVGCAAGSRACALVPCQPVVMASTLPDKGWGRAGPGGLSTFEVCLSVPPAFSPQMCQDVTLEKVSRSCLGRDNGPVLPLLCFFILKEKHSHVAKKSPPSSPGAGFWEVG